MADKCVACGEVAEGKPLYKKLGSSDCQVEVFTALHEMELLSLPPGEKNDHYICWDCDETIAEEYSTFISTEAKKKAVETKRKQQDEARKIKLQKKLKQAFKKAHDEAMKASGVNPPVSKYKMKEKEREENRYHASFCLLCKCSFETSKARGSQRFCLLKMVDDEYDIADVLKKLGLKLDITEDVKRKRFVCCQCYNKIRRNYKALSRGEVSSPLPLQLQETNDQLNAFKRRPTTEEHAAEIAKLIPPSLADLYKVVTKEDGLETAQTNHKSKVEILSAQGERKSKRTRKKNPKYSSSDGSSSNSDSDSSTPDTELNNGCSLENGITTNYKSNVTCDTKETKHNGNESLKGNLAMKGIEMSRVESPKTPTIRTLLPKGANEFGTYDNDVCTPVSLTSGDADIIDFGICNLCGLGYNSRPKEFWYKLSHCMPSVMGVTVLNALQILDSELADVSQSVRDKELVCKPCFSRVCKGFRSQILRRIAEKKGVDVTKLELSKIKVKMVNHEEDENEDRKRLNGALNNNNVNNKNKNVNSDMEEKKKGRNVARRTKPKSLPIKDKQNVCLNGNIEGGKGENQLNNCEKEKIPEKLASKKNSSLYRKGEKGYKFKRCSKAFKKTLAALQTDFELIHLINDSRHLRYKGKVVLLSSVTVDLADLKGILSKSALALYETVRLELYKDMYQFSNFRRNLKNKKSWEYCIVCQKEGLNIEKTTRWLEDPVAPPNLMVPLRWAHLSIASNIPESKVNFAIDDGKVCENCHDTLRNKFGKFVGSRVATSHGLASEKVVLEKYKVSFDSIAMNIVADPLETSPSKESKKKLKEKSSEIRAKESEREELGVEKLSSKKTEDQEAKTDSSIDNGSDNFSDLDTSRKSNGLDDVGHTEEENSNYSKQVIQLNKSFEVPESDMSYNPSLNVPVSTELSSTESESGYLNLSHSIKENKILPPSESKMNGEASMVSDEVTNAEANSFNISAELQDDRDQDTLSMDLNLSDSGSEAEAAPENKSATSVVETIETLDANKTDENNKNFNGETEDYLMSAEEKAESHNVSSVNEEDHVRNNESDSKSRSAEEKIGKEKSETEAPVSTSKASEAEIQEEILELDKNSAKCISNSGKDLISTSVEENVKEINKNAEEHINSSASKLPPSSIDILSEKVVQDGQPQNGDNFDDNTVDESPSSASNITDEKLKEPASQNEKGEELNENLDHHSVMTEDHNSNPSKETIFSKTQTKEVNLSSNTQDHEIDKSSEQKSIENPLPKKRKCSETTFAYESISKKKCIKPNGFVDQGHQENSGEEMRENDEPLPECTFEECEMNEIESSPHHDDVHSELDINNVSIGKQASPRPKNSELLSTEKMQLNREDSQSPLLTSEKDARDDDSGAFSAPGERCNVAVEHSEAAASHQGSQFAPGKRKSPSDVLSIDSEPSLSSFPDSFMASMNEEESEFGEDNIAPFAQRKKFKGKNQTNENQQISEKEALQNCLEEIWHTIQGISLDDLICEGVEFPLRVSQYNVGFLLALNDLRVHLGASLEDLIVWIKRLLPVELREKGMNPSMEKFSMYLLSLSNTPEDLSCKFLRQALPEELFHLQKSHHNKSSQDKRIIHKCYIEDVMEPSAQSSNIKWEDFLAPVNLDNLLAGKSSRVSWNDFNNGLLYALWKVNKMMNEDNESFIKWLSLTSTTVMKEKDYIAMSKAVIAIDKHLQNYPEEINRLVAPIVVRSGLSNKTDDSCPAMDAITTTVNESDLQNKGRENVGSNDDDVILEHVVPTPNITTKKKSNSTIVVVDESQTGESIRSFSSTKKLARVLPQPPTDNVELNDGSFDTPVQINHGNSRLGPNIVSSNEGIMDSVGVPVNSIGHSSCIGQLSSIPLVPTSCQPDLVYNKTFNNVEQNLCSNVASHNNFVNSISYEADQINRRISNANINHPVQMLVKVNSQHAGGNSLQHANNTVLAPVAEAFNAPNVTDPSMQYQSNPHLPIPVVAMRPTYPPVPTTVSSGVPLIPVLNSSGYMTMVPLSVRMPSTSTPAGHRPRFANVIPVAGGMQQVPNQSQVHLNQGGMPSHIYSSEMTGAPSFNPHSNANPKDQELASKVNNLERQLQEIQKQNSRLLEMNQKLLEKTLKDNVKDTEKHGSDTPIHIPTSSSESQSDIPKNSHIQGTSGTSINQNNQRKTYRKPNTARNKNPKPSFQDALNYNYKV